MAPLFVLDVGYCVILRLLEISYLNFVQKSHLVEIVGIIQLVDWVGEAVTDGQAFQGQLEDAVVVLLRVLHMDLVGDGGNILACRA